MHVPIDDGRVRVQSLEFFAIDTCNLRCRQCAASSPFATDPNTPSLDEFRATLRALEPVFRAHQIKILGGEPLLNPELVALMRVARESGVFEAVRVTTNGVLLPKMADEFWALADIVEVSVYPATESKLRLVLPSAGAKALEHGTTLETNPKSEFQLAISDTRIEDEVMVRGIFGSCSEAHEWSCHLLYRNRVYRCSRVHMLDKYLDETGVAHAPFTELDGLAIDPRPTLLQELHDYLSREQPLKACEFCLGTSGRYEPHRQLTLREIKAKRGGSLEPFRPSAIDDALIVGR